jgi:hypothetical protein
MLCKLPCQIHSHRKVSITSVFVEAFGPQIEGDEAYVGIVHSLQLDSGIGTIPRSFVQQIFQSFQNFLEQRTLKKTSFEHFGGVNEFYERCAEETPENEPLVLNLCANCRLD